MKINLKSFVFGFLVSTLLLAGGSVFADTASKIGKKIDSEIKVVLNGEELQTKAVASEGTSYLPVRALANAVGLNVDFKNATVYLTDTETVGIVNQNKGEDVLNLDDYFSLKDYNDNNKPFVFLYDFDTNETYLVEREENSSVIVREILRISSNDERLISHNGTTYLHKSLYYTPEHAE